MYISIEEGTKFFDSATLILNSLPVEKLLAVIHLEHRMLTKLGYL